MYQTTNFVLSAMCVVIKGGMLLAALASSTTHEGKIVRVDTKQVVMDSDSKEVKAAISDETQVLINGKESKPDDLRVGAKATLVAKEEAGKTVAVTITVDTF